MTAQEYSDLLTNFDPKSEDQRKEFEKITYRYPYFQSAYMHYLKTLKAQEQYNYDLILRKTALLSPERETLHQWLEKEIMQPLEVIRNKAVDKDNPKTAATDETEIIKLVKKENSTQTQTAESIPLGKNKKETIKEKPLKKAKPKKKEMPVAMTYVDWVIYSSKGKIPQEENKNSLDEKIALIDTFLENRPKIPPVRQDQPKVDLSANNEFNKEELMTETLAKVYLHQKKFKKALYAYQILSLKYPEKNSFFADQIKNIKQLQQKTKS